MLVLPLLISTVLHHAFVCEALKVIVAAAAWCELSIIPTYGISAVSPHLLSLKSILLEDLSSVEWPFKLVFLTHNSTDFSLWTWSELYPIVLMKVKVHLKAPILSEGRLVRRETAAIRCALNLREH